MKRHVIIALLALSIGLNADEVVKVDETIKTDEEINKVETDSLETTKDELKTTSNENTFGSIKLGYVYKALDANPIPEAYVKTEGLNVAKIAYDPTTSKWGRDLGFIDAFLSYEATLGGYEEQDQVLKRTQSDEESWERYYANLDIDLAQLFGSTTNTKYNISLKYDKQNFITTVQSKKDYWYLTAANTELLLPGDLIKVATDFEDTVFALEMINGTSSSTSKLAGKVGIGYFDMKYNKPFSTSLDTTVQSIYAAEFSAQGIYWMAGWENLSIFDINIDGLITWKKSFDAEIILSNGTNLGAIDNDSGYISSFTNYEYDNYYAEINTRYDELYFPIDFTVTYDYRKFSKLGSGIAKLPTDTIVGFELNIEFGI